MRALILVLSILAIVASADVAKAGLSTTPRETSAPADTAIATDEATQETRRDHCDVSSASHQAACLDRPRLQAELCHP